MMFALTYFKIQIRRNAPHLPYRCPESWPTLVAASGRIKRKLRRKGAENGKKQLVDGKCQNAPVKFWTGLDFGYI